jgi:hypothetical protein
MRHILRARARTVTWRKISWVFSAILGTTILIIYHSKLIGSPNQLLTVDLTVFTILITSYFSILLLLTYAFSRVSLIEGSTDRSIDSNSASSKHELKQE